MSAKQEAFLIIDMKDGATDGIYTDEPLARDMLKAHCDRKPSGYWLLVKIVAQSRTDDFFFDNLFWLNREDGVRLTLPIPIAKANRAEIDRRFNTQLQVILGAAQLDLTHSERAEVRVRAKAIVTAVRRMQEDIKELFA